MIHGTYILSQCVVYGSSVCVREHMCAMDTCMCSHTCGCQKLMSGVFLSCSLMIDHRRVSCRTLSSLRRLIWLNSWSQGSPLSSSQVLGLLGHHTCTTFLWNLGSELQSSCFYLIVPALTANNHCICMTS